MPKFEPTHDWVVIELPEEKDEETTTTSGLVIPSEANYKEDNGLPSGVVVAVGPGYIDNAGNLQVPPVKVGDTIIYMHHSGVQHEEDGVKYYFVNARQSVIAFKRS
jgi:chaperonin GroES